MGDQAKCEFTLKHENGDSEYWAMGEETKDEWGGDLIWCVGDTDVEVREIGFDKIPKDYVEFALVRTAVY